jgi:PAS domain-containing protein
VSQENLVLIIAREFASLIASPTIVTDKAGNLVFFNEAAERVLGRAFSESEEMPAERWAELFTVHDLEGEPLPLERMPAGITLREARPAHGSLRITALDGVQRELDATSFPLFGRPDELVGMIAVFWERASAE